MRMHRLLPCLMLIGAALAVTAPAASAGPPSVDPSTLQPPPPPGASCRLDGRFVICQTELHEVLDAEPILELPCGTLYETARDDREGIRWYEDGLAVRRFVSRHFSGYWTLSATGEGPLVTLSGHSNFWTEWLVPGDEASEQDTFHGLEVLAKAPDGGIVTQVTGVFFPDETHHGIFQIPDEDPAVQAALCDALT
jgi:hypothetical protein